MTLKTFLVVLLIAGGTLAAGTHPAPVRSDAWVPMDFDPKKSVLLIMIESYIKPNGKDYYAKQNESINEMMKNEYPYPYELVLDAKGDKYKDKEKYPYLLFFTAHDMNFTNGSSSSGHMIHIIDLRTGKTSATNGWSYGYKKDILRATIRQMLTVLGRQQK